MENGLREDFQNYVRELTSTISKEIFLEDLKALYGEYTDNIKRLEEIEAKFIEENDRIKMFVDDNTSSVTSLSAGVGQNLSRIEEAMAGNRRVIETITGIYKDKFDEFKAQAASFNDEERSRFMSAAGEMLAKDRNLYIQDISDKTEGLLSESAKIFSAEKQAFFGEFESRNQELNDALKIADGLKGQVEVFSGEFHEAIEENQQNRRAMQAASENVTNMKEEMIKYVEMLMQTIRDQNSTINKINEIYEDSFSEFSAQAISFNEGERLKFVTDIESVIQNDRRTIIDSMARECGERILSQCGDLKKYLAYNVKTMQAFSKSMEAYTQTLEIGLDKVKSADVSEVINNMQIMGKAQTDLAGLLDERMKVMASDNRMLRDEMDEVKRIITDKKNDDDENAAQKINLILLITNVLTLIILIFMFFGNMFG